MKEARGEKLEENEKAYLKLARDHADRAAQQKTANSSAAQVQLQASREIRGRLEKFSKTIGTADGTGLRVSRPIGG